MSRCVIVGTAGHIDHGKTALVEALTGVNTDRWEEERRRGITIDLGFAHLDLTSGLRLAFIDVPGHERFVKNMLAGATGIDLVLMAIAANESLMPQTEEHFEICRLLGVERGVIAITKADLVESDWAELVQMEAAERFAGSFLEEAPCVAVSAKTGAGLPRLLEVLEEQAEAARAKHAEKRFRLPIDRVFSISGHGTVATGTVLSGAVAAEQEVEAQPGGRRLRVRAVQSHGAAADRAEAGSRAALNLAGVDVGDLQRGLTLVEPGVFAPSDRLDCRLELLASAAQLRHGAAVRLHLGTAELQARVLLRETNPETGLPARSLAPGDKGYAQLRLAAPCLALLGDRFVIRRFSPVETIGGGRILDNAPPRRETPELRRERLETLDRATPAAIAALLARRRPTGLPLAELAARTGWSDAEAEAACRQERLMVADRLVVHCDHLEEAERRLLETLRNFHTQEPLAAGAPLARLRGIFDGAPEAFTDSLLAGLARDGRLTLADGLARLPQHCVSLDPAEQEARERWLAEFRDAGFTIPALGEYVPTLPVDAARARALQAQLERERLLIRVSDELLLHHETVDRLLRLLAERKAASPRFNVTDFKQWTGVSRKYAIPLLEYLDRRRATRRIGAERVIL